MKKTLLNFIFLITFSIFATLANAEDVLYVYDGDTFTTKDKKKIRILNINTPETAKKNKPSEPYSVKAKEYLEKLIDNKEVILKYDEEKKDKYNRHLAYVYLKDGTFINAEMLKAGLAHLYTFPKNTSKFKELKTAEEYARKNNLGIWQNKRWQLQNANSEQAVEKYRVGKYQMFKGKVLNIAEVNNKIYLNFGSNWRTDFSVEINKENLKYFNFNPVTKYRDKTLLIRGILRPVNGALINVTHQQQIEIINEQ